MPNLSWADVRSLVIQEARIAGRVWPAGDPASQPKLEGHLDVVLTALRPEMSIATQDDRDSLAGLYMSAARRVGASGQETTASIVELSRENAEARIDAAREQTQHSWIPDETAARSVAEAIAGGTSRVRESDVVAVHREIGRLCGPLWITRTADHVPALAIHAAGALNGAVRGRTMLEAEFDEHTHEMVDPTIEMTEHARSRELIDALEASRDAFFENADPTSPLPVNAEARAADIADRVGKRSQVRRQAESAVQKLIGPIMRASDDALKAEQEERRRAQRAFDDARRAEGFARPSSQDYGVSLGGAILWVRDALRYLGVVDADVAEYQGEGVDVCSARHLLAVRVAHEVEEVPAETLRELHGVAAATGRTAMLWTTGPLSEIGAKFAALAHIAVIRFDVEAGAWSPLNAAGEIALDALGASTP